MGTINATDIGQPPTLQPDIYYRPSQHAEQRRHLEHDAHRRYLECRISQRVKDGLDGPLHAVPIMVLALDCQSTLKERRWYSGSKLELEQVALNDSLKEHHDHDGATITVIHLHALR